MKLYKYMLSGAVIGYAMGCRMESMRKYALRTMKRAQRLARRKLGL